METFRYTGNDQKFIEENQAEIIDIIEGCLTDNYLLSTNNGYIAMIETYVNCWTSCHTVYTSTDSGEIYGIWDKLERNIKEWC